MIRGVINQILLTWRLIRDPRVPLWTKMIPAGVLIYILSPLDIIPDIIPVIGQLDDLGVLLAGMRLFESMVPEYIVEEHRQSLLRRGKPLDVVDAPSYHVSTEDKRKNDE